MGITKTFKKLMGRSSTEDEDTVGEDGLPIVAAGDVPSVPDTATEQNSHSVDTVPDSPDKDSAGTKQNRQVGSKWEHKHDDLDWHSMSRPHPPQTKTRAEKDVSSEPAVPAVTIQPDTSPEQALDDKSKFSKKDILCKFVVQHNKRIGETISIDAGHLVFKNGAEKLSVPMSSVSNITDEDVLVGDFERDEALKLGEEWLKRTTDSLKFDDKGMLIND